MKDTYVLSEELYKVVASCLDKNDKKFRDNIAKFINTRHNSIFDIAPYENIYFNQSDIDNMFNSLGLKEKDVEKMMRNIFWYNKPINPQCVKEPYVEVLFAAIKYYTINNKSKHAELTAIYTLLSGKFYASLYAYIFSSLPPSSHREVMDYVINNLMTNKYDLKRCGSIFGALQSMVITYLDTYKEFFKTTDSSDDDYRLKIQQLRDRLKSFFKTIAGLYFPAYTDKLYMNYETDSLDDDNFRITDNDAARAARITENSMNYLASNQVSLEICNKCKNQNIDALEIKSIMESILENDKNLPKLRRVINIIVCDFMRNYPGESVGTIDFVAYTIKAKPNTKDPYILEIKETILVWLEESNSKYRIRKKRIDTANSYYRAVLMYLALVINKIGRK